MTKDGKLLIVAGAIVALSLAITFFDLKWDWQCRIRGQARRPL